jgi:hypothetical protein
MNSQNNVNINEKLTLRKNIENELKKRIRIGVNLILKSPFLVQDPSDPFEDFY